MIVRQVDQGWGPEWPTKQLEQRILNQYLEPLTASTIRTAVINSVWYSRDNHRQLVKQLQHDQLDHLVLVAMIDWPLIHPDMFRSLEVPISSVGYYKGTDEIDFWAMAVAEHFSVDFDVEDFNQIDTAYLCYNRKPHQHRVELFQELTRQNLVEKGIVTMGSEDGVAQRSLPQDVGQNRWAPNLGYGIVNDIMSLGPPQSWQRCLLNIVTETVFDVDHDWFVSEKIYKPILGMRPFLVYSPNGAQNWLAHIGIESYVKDFEDICMVDVSEPKNIPTLLRELSCLDPQDLKQKYLELLPKMRYNRWKLECYFNTVKTKIRGKIQCQI